MQILLLMANSLSNTTVRSQYLTEATVGSFIAQCLKISRDIRVSVSVSSTALNTARQIVTLVMDAAAATIQSDSSASSESSLSAQMLVRDLSLFSRGLPGELIKGTGLTSLHLALSATLHCTGQIDTTTAPSSVIDSISLHRTES
jgi:hypothetical protein